MGRAWIVVVVLMAAAAEAHADRVACLTLRPHVVPAETNRALPLNAKLWDLGGKPGDYEYHNGSKSFAVQSQLFDSNETYPVYVYPLRELAAHDSYFPEGSGLSFSFVTGDANDSTPPERPTLV